MRKLTAGVVGLAALVLGAGLVPSPALARCSKDCKVQIPDPGQGLQVGVREARQDLQEGLRDSEEGREVSVQGGHEPGSADLLALGRVPALISPLDGVTRQPPSRGAHRRCLLGVRARVRRRCACRKRHGPAIHVPQHTALQPLIARPLASAPDLQKSYEDLRERLRRAQGDAAEARLPRPRYGAVARETQSLLDVPIQSVRRPLFDDSPVARQ